VARREDEGLRLIGHKGADLIEPGNTVASYIAGASNGADTIEIDVLWTRDGHPRLPAGDRTPLICAHDWTDAASRPHPTLAEALAAFTAPPLDTVEIDLDLKLEGREDEVVAALAEAGLTERTIISTMEVESLRRFHRLEPALRLGWTYPRVTRDWTAHWWATPGVLAAMVAMRLRLPRLIAANAEALHLDSVMVFHRLVTPAACRAARAAGVEINAWTVDDLPTMRRLVAAGVTGLISNDPRLFGGLK
jgi:glycerophosphoryl diester phosphodiesterase